MKILNFIRNLFCTTDDLFSVSSDNENTVREFEFDNENRLEIKSNGQIGFNTCCFEFDNPIRCDFDKYQNIELFFMVFDNTKLSIQDYADNYSELSKFFNSENRPIDGVLYLGRDSIDKLKIQEKLDSPSSESSIHESYVYEPVFNEIIGVNYILIDYHISNLLFNEVNENPTSQLSYKYNTYFHKLLNSSTYVKPNIEIFSIVIEGTIRGVDSKSVKQGKISLVSGFKLTKVDSNVQEIHFTKKPLTFELSNEIDNHPTNMLILKNEEKETFKQNESKEFQNGSETSNLSEKVVIGNSTGDYSDYYNCAN